MSSAVRGIEDVIGDVVRMRNRARRPRPAIKESAGIFGKSIRRNFEVGGRPRWKSHAESTRRSTYGPARLLIRSTRLMNSFKPFITAMSGGQRSSGTAYGPRQNFGYEGGPGPGHSPTPARTFALIQPEDATASARVFLDHVTQ